MNKEHISISDIIELHRKVSENIKDYETLTDEYMPLEVSNELRYAFRALIDYLDNTKANKDYDLVRTHYALRCAYFDLVDGLVITVYEDIVLLLKEYPLETTQVISNVLDINEYVHNLNEKIAKSRGGGQEDKLLIYGELHKNEFKTLSLHYRTLNLAKPMITTIINEKIEKKEIEKKEIEERKARDKTSYTVAIVGLIIGIVGIIVAVIN